MTPKRQKCMKRQASSVWPSLKGGRRATPMLFPARHYQVAKTKAPTQSEGSMAGGGQKRRRIGRSHSEPAPSDAQAVKARVGQRVSRRLQFVPSTSRDFAIRGERSNRKFHP